MKEYFTNFFPHIYEISFLMNDNKINTNHKHVESCTVTLVDLRLNNDDDRLKRIKQYYKQKLMR